MTWRSALLIASLILAGCQATPANQTRPTTLDVLRIASSDVGVPTPFRVSTAGPGGAVLLTLIYDTLTWKDDRGIIPWLATAWTISADGRDVTFTLRTDVRWHDGVPLTANDVAFSYTAYARHPYRWVNTEVVERAEAIAADSVRIRLSRPYAPFIETIAGVVPIIPAHIWSKVADPTTYDGSDASLGSGPYRLTEYRAAEGSYRLAANPAYFRGTVTVREVQLLNVPTETRVEAARQGQIDLMQGTDATIADLFRDSPRLKVIETPPLSIVRIAVNTARAPLDRKDVRQAISYAIDRSQLAETITKAPPVPGRAGVLPPGSPWVDSSVRDYRYDPDKARSLLAGERHTIELLADPSYREPELLTPMLAAVGITLTVRRLDAKTRSALLREGGFQLGLVQHIGIGGDPDFLRRWYNGEETNDSAQGSVFRSSRFDALGIQEAAAFDTATRRTFVNEMQAILAEEQPTIVLYYRRFYWVYDARYQPMNSWGGLLDGVPFVQNKLTLLRQ